MQVNRLIYVLCLLLPIWPTTASSVLKLPAYFEIVFLKILPNVSKPGFPRSGYMMALLMML